MRYVRNLLIALPLLAIACGRAEPPKGVVMYELPLHGMLTRRWVDYDKGRIFNDFKANGTLDAVCRYDGERCVYIVDREPEFQGRDVYFGGLDEIISRDSSESREEVQGYMRDFEDTKAKHKKQHAGEII